MKEKRKSSFLGLVIGLCLAGVALAQQNQIAEIRLTGNEVVTTTAILAVLPIKAGAPYVPETLEKCKTAIQGMGYFYEVQYKVDTGPQGVTVIFQVYENPKVSQIRFVGNRDVSTATLAKLLATKPDNILNVETVKRDVEKITNHYKTNGYIADVVDYEMSKEGALTFTIVELEIEKITLTGLKKTREYVVRREVKAKPGDIFNSRKINQDLNRIYNTNIFEEVTFEPQQGSEMNKVVVAFQIKEKRTGTASLGLGYSSRDRTVGFLDLSESNFRGKAQQVNMRTEVGGVKSFEVGFYEPWVDKRHTSLDLKVYDTYTYRYPKDIVAPSLTTDQLYREKRKGINATMGRPIADRTVASIGLKKENVTLINVENAPAQDLAYLLESQGRVTSLTLSVAKDTRDIIMDPSMGSMQRASTQIASSFLGGEKRFRKYDIDLRKYLGLSKKMVWAHRFLYGMASSGVTYFDQYYVGGAETLRGYTEDQFRGDHMMVFNSEFRYRIQKTMQVVFFFDYGSAWGGKYAANPVFAAAHSIGFGLRVQTPIGPLRLDYGRGSMGARTHFSIGQVF